MSVIATPRASDLPSSGATVATGTAAALGVDGATRGSRGGERRASAPLLGASQAGRSARTSSRRSLSLLADKFNGANMYGLFSRHNQLIVPLTGQANHEGRIECR